MAYFNLVKFLECIIIVRILRLSVYLQEIKVLRIILETLRSLLNPFWSVLTVLFTVFYVYTMLGMLLFGGKISFQTEEILNNDSTPNNWALNNFNDFFSGYVTLFGLVIVNNWMVTADMYVNIAETKWVLLYFVSFYVIAVLVGLNIIVCFAIDMYASIRRLDNEQSAHEKKLHELAIHVKKQKLAE